MLVQLRSPRVEDGRSLIFRSQYRTSEDFRDGSLDRSRPEVRWIEALQEAVRVERVLHCSSSWLVASPVAIQVLRGYPLVSVRWIYLLVDFGDPDLESLTVAHFWRKLVGF